jgi:hypothetical protein
MSDDSHTDDAPAGGAKKRPRRGSERAGWSPPDHAKGAPRPNWSGKTMHHPAFRIGEIKHGKS